MTRTEQEGVIRDAVAKLPGAAWLDDAGVSHDSGRAYLDPPGMWLSRQALLNALLATLAEVA